MILWHGSNELFNEFNLEYIGKNGTNEGFGVYLSSDERIARNYSTDDGYLYEVEVELENSINDKEKKFSYEEYKRFLKHIQPITGFLDNYGEVEYEGLEKVLKTATDSIYNEEDSDVNILGGIINAGGATVEEINVLYSDFFNVTHIVEDEPKWGQERSNHEVYVVLNPKTIKIKEVKKINKTEV